MAIGGTGKDYIPVRMRRTLQTILAVKRSRSKRVGVGRDLHVVALRVVKRDAPGRSPIAAVPAVVIDVVVLRDALSEQEQHAVRSAMGGRGGQACAAYHAARGRQSALVAAAAVFHVENELPLAQIVVGGLDA